MKAPDHGDTDERMRTVLRAALPGLLARCRDPWVVLGSGAAWLAGAAVTVADLDVLTSVRDADSLGACWRMRRRNIEGSPGADRFRSCFARYAFPGLAVEVMGGLEVWSDGGWIAVDIGETVVVDFAGLRVPIPSVAEQIRILESFGRPKDQRRVRLLQSLRETSP